MLFTEIITLIIIIINNNINNMSTVNSPVKFYIIVSMKIPCFVVVKLSCTDKCR